ncbi:unnamed protein product [Ixodes pacificus]
MLELRTLDKSFFIVSPRMQPNLSYVPRKLELPLPVSIRAAHFGLPSKMVPPREGSQQTPEGASLNTWRPPVQSANL